MRSLLLSLALLGVPEGAFAKCQVNDFATLPITITGRKAVTEVSINGQPVKLAVDSGAFFSNLTPAVARELHLNVADLPQLHVHGIGGEAGSVGKSVVRSLGIAGITVNDVTFVVSGSQVGAADGLLGQNFLGLHDVEYDLEHGAVRLMRVQQCGGANIAYWAGDRPVTILPIESLDASSRHTVATIMVNGVKLHAAFDTGAAETLIDVRAARRLGITPQSPGVVPDGLSHGLGTRMVPAWLVPIASIDLGGEQLRNVKLHMTTLEGTDVDMLIGIDFFLSHRVFVDNADRRMFFTYDGGPVFGVSPKRAVNAEGGAIALTDTAPAPTDAANFSARGTALATKQDFGQALADLDQAVALAPLEGRYRLQRAQVQLALHKPALAFADLEEARRLAPGDPEILMLHAAMAALRGDSATQLADLHAADAAIAAPNQARLQLARLYDAAGDYRGAAGAYSDWLRYHSDDALRPVAFNGRCWARAVQNVELDKALDDCNAALRLQPGVAEFLANRGLVQLRRGQWRAAIADFKASLAKRPDQAWTRFELALAEAHAGLPEAALDREAALSGHPELEKRAARLGLS